MIAMRLGSTIWLRPRSAFDTIAAGHSCAGGIQRSAKWSYSEIAE